MVVNGRPPSLRPRLAHALRLALGSQRRSLNEFISRAPETTTPSRPDSFRLAVKDNIATGPHDQPALPMTMTCGSAMLSSYYSPFEATIVRQLKDRGAVVVGKTNMDEFGMGTHSTYSAHGPVAREVREDATDGPTTLLSAGGSSGGSALAVATGVADLALGTDTGGSVRLPAAYCGLVGYKPSYGMISRYGVVPYANSLDTVGFFARDASTIRHLVVARGLYLEHDPRDPTSMSPPTRARCTASRESYHHQSPPADAPPHRSADQAHKDLLRPLVFGIPVEYQIAELKRAVRVAWEGAAVFLRDKVGATVVPVSLPSTRHALSAYYVIAPAEASSNLAKYDGVRYGINQPQIEVSLDRGPEDVLYSAVRGQGFGPEAKRRILLGSYTLSSQALDNYFLQAQRVRQLVRQDFDRVFRLSNPLRHHEDQQFSLADMPESVPLETKRGPAQVDFLLCPTAASLPPLLHWVDERQRQRPVEAYMNDVLTAPASLAGLPAVSIPSGPDSTRLSGQSPAQGDMVGLQLIGQYWDDARLLAAAAALDSLLDSS